jgi:hypothetical protein
VRIALCAVVVGVAVLVACGGSSNSGASASFDCRSKCPKEPFYGATSCQAVSPGVCTTQIAAFLQCEHDNEVCNSSGYTDYTRTDASCTAQMAAQQSCFTCGSSDCPDAGGG